MAVSSTSFEPGNEARLVHGGERAIKKLASGEPLAGLAAELKEAVSAEIEMRGLVAVMRERAERHQAVADLFFGLILGAKDIKTADRYVQRFGWLNSKAFAMLREMREMERDRGDGLIVDAVRAAREAGDGHNDAD